MTRCDCCDLPVESCGRAVERAQLAQLVAERRRLLALPGVIAAQYPGACSGCGERFVVGDPIARHEGRWNAWRSLLCCEVAR